MCTRCDSRYQGLIAPSAITDVQAVKVLESMFSSWEKLMRNWSEPSPIGPILKSFHIQIPWVYLIGFNHKLPLTLFISEDKSLMDTFERQSNRFPDYEIQEKW